MDRGVALWLACVLFAATGSLLFQTGTADLEGGLSVGGNVVLRGLKDDIDDDESIWKHVGGYDDDGDGDGDDEDGTAHTPQWYAGHECKPGSYKSVNAHVPVKATVAAKPRPVVKRPASSKAHSTVKVHHAGSDDDEYDGGDTAKPWPAVERPAVGKAHSTVKVQDAGGDDDGGDDKRRLLSEEGRDAGTTWYLPSSSGGCYVHVKKSDKSTYVPVSDDDDDDGDDDGKGGDDDGVADNDDDGDKDDDGEGGDDDGVHDDDFDDDDEDDDGVDNDGVPDNDFDDDDDDDDDGLDDDDGNNDGFGGHSIGSIGSDRDDAGDDKRRKLLGRKYA